MRILFIAGSLNQGGAEFQLLLLARLFKANGHDVEVFAITDYDFYLPFILKNQIKYSCNSNKGNNFIRLSRAVNQIIRKKPDVAISYIKRVSQVAILARCCSFFKFKLIISERTSKIQPWHDLYYFNLCLLANKLIINSISKFNYIRKKFPLIRNKAMFIPNIIDLEKFSSFIKRESIAGTVRLAYVGRISPEKNILNLINAVRIIVNKEYKIKLTLCGESKNGKYLNELTLLIEKLNLKNIVNYIGPVDNVIDVYEQTDLLCLVSFYEGFSNVLAEAISCGIPVLASDLVENKYLVEDKENGFLVDQKEPYKIAEGIERFLRLSPDEVKLISEKNRKKSENIFNNETVYEKYNEIFQSLFTNHK